MLCKTPDLEEAVAVLLQVVKLQPEFLHLLMQLLQFCEGAHLPLHIDYGIQSPIRLG